MRQDGISVGMRSPEAFPRIRGYLSNYSEDCSHFYLFGLLQTASRAEVLWVRCHHWPSQSWQAAVQIQLLLL